MKTGNGEKNQTKIEQRERLSEIAELSCWYAWSFYSILKHLVVSTPALLASPLYHVPSFLPLSSIFIFFFRKYRSIFVLTPTYHFKYSESSVEYIEQKLVNIEWNASSLSFSVAFCYCIQSGTLVYIYIYMYIPFTFRCYFKQTNVTMWFKGWYLWIKAK